MAALLMPKSTALWLINNTSLSFEQIAECCGLHCLEIQALADDETSQMLEFNPITALQLTADEITRCEKDPNARLRLHKVAEFEGIVSKKKAKYTPLSKRQEKPDAILWILKYYPEIPELKICKLLGTTKIMIRSIRSKTHHNSANLKPINPVQSGLCTQAELDQVLAEIKRDQVN